MQESEENGGGAHFWDASRFMSRYNGMQEMYQNWVENSEKINVKYINGELIGSQSLKDEEEDPFFESVNHAVPLGTATLFLQNLAYLIEMDEQVVVKYPQIILKNGNQRCQSSMWREWWPVNFLFH